MSILAFLKTKMVVPYSLAKGFVIDPPIRALSKNAGGLTPAIALTGYATRKDRERSLASGYQLHIAKPIEQSQLVSAISSLLREK